MNRKDLPLSLRQAMIKSRYSPEDFRQSISGARMHTPLSPCCNSTLRSTVPVYGSRADHARRASAHRL
jgi:hypothetical protein